MIEWKAIDGKYEVSNTGLVRSLSHVDHRRRPWPGRVLSPFKTGARRNYLCVSIDRKAHKVHRLVAYAFLPAIVGKDHVNHKDGNTFNNDVSNLEWVTPKENVIHAYMVLGRKSSGGHHGKFGQLHHASKMVRATSADGSVTRTFGSTAEAARFIGCSSGSVPRTCNGLQKTSKGWLCEYV